VPPQEARDNLFRARVSYVQLSFYHSFVRGARTPHSALPRTEDSICCATGLLFCFFLGRISLGDGWRCLVN
jgi:hypothetical protein